jgi:putative ABC transport system permease protein
MAFLTTFLRRLRGSMLTTRFESEMDAELQHHLELEVEQLVRRGMTPAEARASAQRTFGSVAYVKDECRESWGMRAIDTMGQDLRYGVRNLRKHPAYTTIVLLTLGLGIGANTAIFSVVQAVLLNSLPYGNGARLVEVKQQQMRIGVDNAGMSPKELAGYRAQTAALDAVVEYHQMSFNLLGKGDASRVTTGVVSPNFFEVMGIRPVMGRTFRAEDDAKDAPAVLVLSHPYWQNALGGDPAVIGRTFEMNDRVHTVVGVLPPVPQFNPGGAQQDNDVYMPTSACPFRQRPAVVTGQTVRMVNTIGLLKPGITLARAQGDLALVANRLQNEFASRYPDSYGTSTGFTATATLVKDELTQQARPTILVLFATTAFVLLLVCANVANLTLARLVGRERELTLRAALGAGRGRIARQLLTESMLLALGGGALGLLFAAVTRTLLVAFTARFTPRASEIGIDGRVLLFALGASIVTGLLAGLLPALPRRTELAEGLKDGQRTVSNHGFGARRALIVAQVAISFVLLIAAGLMVRSFIRLQEVDAGFNADHVLSMQVTLDWVQYDTPLKRYTYFHTLLDRLAAAPDVKSAALGIKFPLDDSQPFTAGFTIKGHPTVVGQAKPVADYRVASGDYFKTIGMKLLSGRAFNDGDVSDAPPVAIVNLSMARHQFGAGDPIGQQVSFDGEHWITIVGMVNDVKQYGLATTPADELYLSFAQRPPLGASLLVRTAEDPRASLRGLQAIVRAIDPKQPMSRIETLDEARSRTLVSPRLTTMLVTLFAVVALIITAAGIAGVVSFSVNQRTTEIGVRMALGARRSAVVAMILRQGLTPVAIGLAVGMAGAAILGRLLTRLLFAIDPTDPPTFAIVIGVLALVAALACLVPARRAAAIDPMQALRAS